jgi:ABC-2 type transport system permease protein
MNRLATLAATEARLLVRDWTVLTFAFVFPAFVMLILAGVFGNEPDDGYDMKRPDDYYVAASIGVPMIALALVGLPVALASYRERGVLRRLEAFGVSVGRVVAAQAVVTCCLIVLGAGIVLALAVPTYGVPHVVHPLQTVLGVVVGTVSLVLIGIAIGLAVPSARAAQAIGLLAFFPVYLLGGGGPPRGAMTGPMQAVSEALPSTVPAITEPWLGVSTFSSQLVALTAWGAAALAASYWFARRREA